MPESASDLARRWTFDGAGARYVRERWSDARRAARDPRTVARLLAGLGAVGPVLDVPCGTGRLRAAIEGQGRAYVGLDASPAMLAEAGGRRVRGDLARLPVRDGAFEAVVCCRLLHHLADEDALARAVAELVRASRRWVIASFWDRASVPALRARLAPRAPAGGGRGRVPHARALVARALAAAGADVVRFAPRLPGLARQVFVVAERRR